MADNWMKDEEAKALSEKLKMNTTLTELDLSGERKQCDEKSRGMMIEMQVIQLEPEGKKD